MSFAPVCSKKVVCGSMFWGISVVSICSNVNMVARCSGALSSLEYSALSFSSPQNTTGKKNVCSPCLLKYQHPRPMFWGSFLAQNTRLSFACSKWQLESWMPVLCVCSRIYCSISCSGAPSSLRIPIFLFLLSKYSAFFLSKLDSSKGMSDFVLCAFSKCTWSKGHVRCARCWSKSTPSPCMFWGTFFSQNTWPKPNDLGSVHLLKYLAFFLLKSSNGGLMSGFVLCTYSKTIEEKIHGTVGPKRRTVYSCSGALSSL
jgi:hypothetical protein